MSDPLVTIHVNQDGVRISRVTREGEEVVEPDLEGKILTTLAWWKVARSDLSGHSVIWPRLEAALRLLTELRDEVRAMTSRHGKMLDALQTALDQAKDKPAPVFVPPPPTAQ